MELAAETHSSNNNNDPDVDNNGDGDKEMVPFVWDMWAVSDYVPYDKKTFVPQLEVADEVWIKKGTAGYSHVALYIGRSKIVHVAEVDKTGLLPGKTRVSKDHISKIAKDHVVGHRKTNATEEEKKIIVARALGDVGKLFKYVLTKENCEHQVKYWISGKQDYSMTISTQIKDYLMIAGIFCLIGLGVGGSICGSLLDDALPIVAGTLGGGIGFAVLGVGLKYLLTAFEHRTFWY